MSVTDCGTAFPVTTILISFCHRLPGQRCSDSVLEALYSQDYPLLPCPPGPVLALCQRGTFSLPPNSFRPQALPPLWDSVITPGSGGPAQPTAVLGVAHRV